MRIALHTSVLNLTSQSVYQLYHISCLHCSVGNIQSNCNKRTVFSHSIQSHCAVSSVKQYSTQTVHRPTAALPSGFWHHWIHSLPKLYTATGTEIAVGLGVELNFETGNGAWIGFWNVCALESNDAAVGLRSIHRTVCTVTTEWIEQVALGKDNIQVVYMQNRDGDGGWEGVQKEGGS